MAATERIRKNTQGLTFLCLQNLYGSFLLNRRMLQSRFPSKLH